MYLLIYSGLLYLLGISIVLVLKPELMFLSNGSWKEFGIGRSKERYTWLPFWLFAIMWAIISYIIVLVIASHTRSEKNELQEKHVTFIEDITETQKYKRPSLTMINNNIILDKICKKKLKPIFSSIRFLSVTYTNKEQTYSITLNVYKECLVVGNEILGYTHVLRMLEYQNEPFVFKMDYFLDIIDSNINIFHLKSNEYLKMEKEGYIVERLDDI
jgi:hypothetical protein